MLRTRATRPRPRQLPLPSPRPSLHRLQRPRRNHSTPGRAATGSFGYEHEQLGRAEERDTGLGLAWVWINAEAGYSFADLGSFSSDSLGITTTSSSGAEFGLGAGVRLFTLTAGLRMRDMPLSVGNVVELDGEVGFHSTGNFQAYFGARGGYLFSGSLSANAVGGALSNGGTPADVTFHGGNLGLMLGFDYYFNHYISLGIDANPEFMFIERPPVPLPTIPPLTYQGQTVMCPSQVMQIQSNVCAPYQSAVATRNAILANPVYKEFGLEHRARLRRRGATRRAFLRSR